MSALELKLPPVAVALLAAALIWLAARALPSLDLAIPWRHAGAGIFVFGGGLIALIGAISFRRTGTTLNPLRPEAASNLVRSGLFAYSRNPMYLGLLVALVGWSLQVSNAAAVPILAGFVAYMNRFQIRPEERALEQLFGADFVDYRRHVRRWI